MKNARLTVAIDPDVEKELAAYAAASGLKTSNTLLAAAGIELAKAAKKGLNLWHVLGRIAADDENARPAIEDRRALAAPQSR